MIYKAFGFFTVSMLLVACATPLKREQKAAAVPFAEAWLHYLDTGGESEAWEATGALTRQRLDREATLKRWFGSRNALGRLENRRLSISWERDDRFLAAVPEDGTYWEVGFISDFEHKQDAREALLLVWEGGGWRLLDYRIR